MAPGSSSGRLRRLAIVAAGGVLHILLLCAPVAFVSKGCPCAENPKITVFLLVVTAWYFVESIASAAEVRLPLRSTGPQRLPLAIGLSLLITFWVSLTHSALSSSTAFGFASFAGTMVMMAGIVLRYLSLRTLGGFFLNEVALMPGQPLVTTGIYGSLRHPSETGTICVAFGGAIVLGSGAGLLAGMLLVLPFLIYRTRLEDRMLRSHYATEFLRYAREVPAFLPSIRLNAR